MAEEKNQKEIKRPYMEQARKICNYLLKEIEEHSETGGEPSKDLFFQRYLASYLEIQLSTAHEGGMAEEEARKLAHQMTEKDIGSLLY